jgi:hypothetical protein
MLYLRTAPMASPRNPPVPRLAPVHSMSLPAALNAFGKACDPAWTGDEILAEPEPSDDELASSVSRWVKVHAGSSPSLPTDLAEQHAMLAEMRRQRDIEFVARRRWQAAAIALLRHLHRGALRPTAMGSDGMPYEVPPHLWAAESAEALFDNGGYLEVRSGKLVVPRRPITAEDTAIVLVDGDQLQDLITAILDEGTASPPAVPPASETQQLDVGRRGKPGRPSPTAQPIEEELRRRAAAGECASGLRAEAKALLAWAVKTYPNEHHMTVEGLENRIRDLYWSLVPSMK